MTPSSERTSELLEIYRLLADAFEQLTTRYSQDELVLLTGFAEEVERIFADQTLRLRSAR